MRRVTIRDSATGPSATGDSPTAYDTASALVARLRAALAAALGSGDRATASAVRSALAAVGNAEAVDPATQRGHAARGGLAAHGGPAAQAMAPSAHFAGARAGLGAGEVPRKRLTASDVTQIVQAEITERQSAAAEYDRLGHGGQAERLRREADVLAAVLDPEHRTTQPVR